MIDNFRGSQKAKIDDRGRIKIPSMFLDIFLEGYKSTRVYITSVDAENVLLYPIKAWVEIEKKTESEIMTDPVDEYAAKTSFWGKMNDIDQRGRILVQNELRQKAHLDNEVLFVGKFNHLEVWNSEAFINKYIKHKLSDKSRIEVASLFKQTKGSNEIKH